jgi:hypothetical protein
VKAPTDASVWTAAAAAFLLGVVALREHSADGRRKFDADANPSSTPDRVTPGQLQMSAKTT